MDGPVVEQSTGQGVWELSYPHPNALALLRGELLGLGTQCPGRLVPWPAQPHSASAGGRGGPGWLEAPTAGPSGMGGGSRSMPIPAQQVCRWMGMHQNEQRDVALAFGSPQLLGSWRMRHVMVHLPQGVKCGCPLCVSPTSRNNSKDTNEGFLLITSEGGLPFCSDFRKRRVWAHIRGSSYAEKNTQL